MFLIYHNCFGKLKFFPLWTSWIFPFKLCTSKYKIHTYIFSNPGCEDLPIIKLGKNVNDD